MPSRTRFKRFLLAVGLLTVVVPAAPFRAQEICVKHNGEDFCLVDRGAVVPEFVWAIPNDPFADVLIPVCWINPTSENEKERGYVQEAIAETWERYAMIDFKWADCSQESVGVRILIDDSGPHTVGLGTSTAYSMRARELGYGMILNFSFKNWPYACWKVRGVARIKDIAVHEFGHVLAFAHEHNRADREDWCRKKIVGTVPSESAYTTAWDGESEMNYCFCDSDYELSDLDVKTVQAIYRERRGN